MNPLLEQFLSEGRDFLQGIGEKLMQLEEAPDDAELMTALFRMVHTLKGNSGLFEFPEMTRVLHAGEDLMDGVRHGQVAYSKELADRLLDAMDFVGVLFDEIETGGGIGAVYAADSVRLAASLRLLIARIEGAAAAAEKAASAPADAMASIQSGTLPRELPLADIAEDIRMEAYRRACEGQTLYWLDYSPAEECFFQGDDPFFQARNTPDTLWGSITAREVWPKLAEMDAYRCILDFHLLTAAPREELDEYFRYMPEQVHRVVVQPLLLALPQGESNGGPVHEDWVVDALGLLEAGNIDGLERAARTVLERSNSGLWLSSALRWLLLVMEREPENRRAFGVLIESLRHLESPQWAEQASVTSSGAVTTPTPVPESLLTENEIEAMQALVAVQREILSLPIKKVWQMGRLKAVAATLSGCLSAAGEWAALPGLKTATAQALDDAAATPLLEWIDEQFQNLPQLGTAACGSGQSGLPSAVQTAGALVQPEAQKAPPSAAEGEVKFGRRAEDAMAGPKSLKVDQAKIDRLMNLIGEMVVSKNALPTWPDAPRPSSACAICHAKSSPSTRSSTVLPRKCRMPSCRCA
jgi:two-component system chemotaxis sensor kinase CheA